VVNYRQKAQAPALVMRVSGPVEKDKCFSENFVRPE